MFSSGPHGGGRLHFGQIMSLSDIEKWDPNAKESVEVGHGLKTEAEIQQDCLDESLVGIPRCLHILTKGTSIQKWSVLDSLWTLLEQEGERAYDALFPPLLKLLCTWDTDLQIEAARIYTSILEKTKDLAVRIRKREEEDIYMYDPSELPKLPWMIDQERIETWILPTILVLADAEGSPLKEESAQYWLEPLFVCMGMITPECLTEKVLSFAIHKRDPTGSITSRVAAAKLMGPLASRMEPKQIQEKLFTHVVSLCQDSNPYVRLVTCQQLNIVARCLLGVPNPNASPNSSPSGAHHPSYASAAASNYSNSAAGVSTAASSVPSYSYPPFPPTILCATTATSAALLHKLLSELETLLAKDECAEVRVEAWKALVDLADFLPESVRRTRLLPLVKSYCTGTVGTTPTTHSSASLHGHSPSVHFGTATQGALSTSGGNSSASSASSAAKALSLNLMRGFGELMWKVSGDLASTEWNEGSTYAKVLHGWYKTAVMQAYVNAGSMAAQATTTATTPSGPGTSSSSSPLAPAPPLPTGSTQGLPALLAAAAAQAKSPGPPPPANADAELRRLAAFHFPAVVKIALGGYWGEKGGNTVGIGGGGANNASSNSTSSSAPTSYVPPASSTNLSAKTLALLESLHGLVLKFSSDPDPEVRRITASSIGIIMSLWPGDFVLKQFKDTFLSFMLVQKHGLSVTEACLSRLDLILDVFHFNKGEDALAPMLGEVLRCITIYETSCGLSWRKKLTLIQQAGRFYSRVFMLDMVNLHEKFIPILFEAMKSGPIPLKLAAVDTLVTFIKTFPYTYRRHELCSRIAREFGCGKSYAARQIYCEVVRTFFHRFSYKWIKRHIFSSFLNMLKNDPVVNVRRKFIEVLPLLKYTIKSTTQDQILFEQFKQVVGELAGTIDVGGASSNANGFTSTSSSTATPGDPDPLVRASALALWNKMDSIDINTEYDRLNRKKEQEEDAMDREEENLAINLNLAGVGGSATSRSLNLDSGAHTPELVGSSGGGGASGKKKNGAFEKRRNNSVIVTGSSAGLNGLGNSGGSKDPSSPSLQSTVSLPLSSRTSRAKLKVSSSISESPPSSPGMQPEDHTTGGTPKGFGRARAISFTEKSPNAVSSPTSGASNTVRPGSSAGSSHSLSTPSGSPLTPKSPNSGGGMKLRPRSHSVLLSPTAGSFLDRSSSSDGTIGGVGGSHASSQSFGGVKEESDEEDDHAHHEKSHSYHPKARKPSISISNNNVTTASFAVNPAQSPQSNSSSGTSTPTKTQNPKHKRRPSTLSVTTGNLPSGSGGQPNSAGLASPGGMLSPLSPGAGLPLVSSPSISSGGSKPHLNLGGSLSSSSKPLVEKPSIISALLRGNSSSSAAASVASANSEKLPGMTPSGMMLHHTTSYTGPSPLGLHPGDEPMSAPLTHANSVGGSSGGFAPRRSSSPPPPSSGVGGFSSSISGARFRQASIASTASNSSNGSMSARSYSSSSNSSGMASLSHSHEEKLVLPKLNNLSSSGPVDFKGISPRIQRMNLHSAAATNSPTSANSPTNARSPNGAPVTSAGSPSPPSSGHGLMHRSKRTGANDSVASPSTPTASGALLPLHSQTRRYVSYDTNM